ncbi:helix-turn-helix domain-containing protein [Streptomyces sp. ISL-43]|uniref:helix-turn-helix domain-containing protein n=1 Tax=Streptomyces sp. ISL-43 TaxID=2819183 RepID=UPI001BE589E8|nr:helix-turn-helix domain-containing protein [Streptomyces sp. ISL-43]MBT2449452.1 helix-turn-helix domain-containing protein [Streptomyces sp. ISL-43]
MDHLRPIPEHCHRGHRLDDTNLFYNCNGTLLCRSCRHDIERAYRHRKFAQKHAGHDVTQVSDNRRHCRTCRTADLDEVAVERATAGDPPAHLNTAERAAAVFQLTSKGLTNAAIAQRIRCHPRTVYAIRQRNRAQTAT